MQFFNEHDSDLKVKKLFRFIICNVFHYIMTCDILKKFCSNQNYIHILFAFPAFKKNLSIIINGIFMIKYGIYLRKIVN